MAFTTKIIIGIFIDNFVNREMLEDTVYHIELNLQSTIQYEIDYILFSIKRDIIPEHLFNRTTHLNSHQNNRPSAFNILIKHTANYYLFLEAGCYLAPYSLDLLIKPFAQSKSIGLTGPSSNFGSNKQNIFNDNVQDTFNILKRSEELQGQYSQEMVSVSGLLEHCFVVSRSVIDSIGEADVNYTDGYYWEADYHKRACLSGYQCQWVKAAYIHKYITSNSVNAAKIRTTSNKINSRSYQQKFGNSHQTNNTNNTDKNPKNKWHYSNPEEAVKSGKNYPLISCIMPTKGRANYLQQSLHYYSQQTYPNTELIIVYEHQSDLPENISDFNNVYTFLTPANSSIGHKRNIALEESCGEVIVHWDDDDWYAKERLFEQAHPLLNDEADISALINTRFFVLNSQEAWSITANLYQNMFLFGVPAGTIMYKANIIDSIRYKNVSLREDALFLEELIHNNARLAKIDGRDLFVYIRHENNTWVFQSGEFVSENDWKKDDITELISDDIDFYQHFDNAKPKLNSISTTEELLDKKNTKVSCIMPTGNRRDFVANAIRYFLAQSYADKELIIIDDGDDETSDLISIKYQNIKYIRLNKKLSIGEKRNLAIEHATGEVIVHWDDDDWIASDWLKTQVDELLSSQADLVGIKKAYYFNPTLNKAWQYSFPINENRWVLGGSMCYRKRLWQTNKFSDMYIGEDNQFLSTMQNSKIIPHENSHLYVGIIHENNVSPKQTDSAYWQEINMQVIKDIMQSEFYNYL